MTTSSRLGGIVAATLVMAASGSPARAFQMNADWPDIVGRWHATALPDGGERTLPIEAVEIAPCGETGLCGRVIKADGGCGPVVVRIDYARAGIASGSMTIRGRDTSTHLRRIGEGLEVQADPTGRALLSRRSLNLVAHYLREGPPRCAPAVS